MQTTARRHRGVSLLVAILLLTGLLSALSIARSQAANASVSVGDLVFDSTQFGGGEPQIARLHSSTTTNLSGDSLDDQYPAVSPDGSRIVYQSTGHSDSSENGLYVMNSDGSNKTQVTYTKDAQCDPGTCADVFPAWSSDGTKIVFERYFTTSSGVSYRIDEVNADGTGLTALASVNDGSSLQTPAWAPDDSKIAYQYCPVGTGECDIYKMNTDGTSPAEVLSGTSVSGYSAYDPAWSPDSSKIYFDNQSDIFSVTASGGSLNQLTNSSYYGGSNWKPTVSADGSTVAYINNTNVYTISSTAHLDDGTAATSNSYNNLDPSYVTAAWPNGSTKTIVALGDSVAAGEGINYGYTWDGSSWNEGTSSPGWMDTAPALGATYDQCHQSGHGYPNLLSLSGGNYNVINMACTGASGLQNSSLENGGVLDSELFDSTPQPYPGAGGSSSNSSYTVPAQLGGTCTGCDSPNTGINFSSLDAVTLTMGANDIDFAGWIRKCYAPLGSACGSSSDSTLLNSQLSNEQTDLRSTLTELNRRAGLASETLKVVVTNYYDPFNASNDTCVDYKVGPDVLLTGSELSFLENGLTDLNSNISDEVTYAQAHDSHLSVSLADLSSVMDGHQWCSSNPWVYGVSIDYSDYPGPFNPAPFHPTPAGQHAIMEIVKTALGI